EDVRLEVLQDRDPRLLEVGQEDGVVHVAHRVAVAEANMLGVPTRELAVVHGAGWYRRRYGRRDPASGLRATRVAAGRPDGPAAAAERAHRLHRLRGVGPRP